MQTVTTWNVNGIRAGLRNGLMDWLRDTKPDIFCVQETKAHPDQLESDVLAPDGYQVFWNSAEKKGYSGVATFTKRAPLAVYPLGVDEFDREGRVLTLDFQDYTVINAYFPNSQEGGARLDYKLRFCDAMLAFCDRLRRDGKNLVLCGDYNIAHKPIDLKNPKANEKNPGYLPEERAWMDRFVASGYVDTFRMFNSEPGFYTWWSYRFQSRLKDIGWRIDYHCVNEEFRDKVQSVEIQKHVLGSDHCPVTVHLSVR